MSTHTLPAPLTTHADVRVQPRYGLPLLAGLLVLRTALLFAGDGVIAAVARAAGASVGPAMTYADVSIVAVDLITLTVLARLTASTGGLRAVIGRIRLGRDLAIAVPVTLALLVAFVVATFAANLVVYGGPPPAGPAAQPPLWLGIWAITVMPITVALAEETLYRGVLLDQLRQRWGAVAAVVATSVFFGLQHAALSTSSPQAMLARVLATFGVGLLFAGLALKLNRLLPLIVAHWIIDVVGLGLPMLILATR